MKESKDLNEINIKLSYLHFYKSSFGDAEGVLYIEWELFIYNLCVCAREEDHYKF